MPRHRRPHDLKFRVRMVERVRAGRIPDELALAFDALSSLNTVGSDLRTQHHGELSRASFCAVTEDVTFGEVLSDDGETPPEQLCRSWDTAIP